MPTSLKPADGNFRARRRARLSGSGPMHCTGCGEPAGQCSCGPQASGQNGKTLWRNSMHDLDRVRLELGARERELEAEQFEFNEMEAWSGEAETVFGEMENMELASELLEVGNEAELEYFLGGLIKKAGHALGGFIKSSDGQALVGMLKKAAGKLLPQAGAALGGAIGGSEGARLGGQAASLAGRAFGLELEGLSDEDREFEVARRFVDLAGEAVKNLVQASPGQAHGGSAAGALAAAIQARAPGLVLSTPGPQHHGRAKSGSWVRRGHSIILIGA
jgi:hypothetical protein